MKYGGYSGEILSLVPPAVSVLDIGCSTGELARLLKSQKECRIVGIDIDDEALRKASTYCEKTIKCDVDDSSDLERHLQGITFDVVALGDIVEHLKDPSSLLKTLRNHLKQGGTVIASIPNAGFISLRVKFLIGDYSYSKNGGLMDEAHLRFFSFKTARALFEESGFFVKRIYGINIVKDKYWFLRILGSIWPSLFSIHIIVVAQQ